MSQPTEKQLRARASHNQHLSFGCAAPFLYRQRPKTKSNWQTASRLLSTKETENTHEAFGFRRWTRQEQCSPGRNARSLHTGSSFHWPACHIRPQCDPLHHSCNRSAGDGRGRTTCSRHWPPPTYSCVRCGQAGRTCSNCLGDRGSDRESGRCRSRQPSRNPLPNGPAFRICSSCGRHPRCDGLRRSWERGSHGQSGQYLHS